MIFHIIEMQISTHIKCFLRVKLISVVTCCSTSTFFDATLIFVNAIMLLNFSIMSSLIRTNPLPPKNQPRSPRWFRWGKSILVCVGDLGWCFRGGGGSGGGLGWICWGKRWFGLVGVMVQVWGGGGGGEGGWFNQVGGSGSGWEHGSGVRGADVGSGGGLGSGVVAQMGWGWFRWSGGEGWGTFSALLI